MIKRVTVTLLQIVIIVFGIFAFTYFIGEEIKIVDAEAVWVVEGGVKTQIDKSALAEGQIPYPTEAAADEELAKLGTGTGASGAIAVAKPDSTYLSNFLGTGYAEGDVVGGKTLEAGSWKIAGGGADALASGLQWAVVAYFAGTMLGE